MTEQTTPEAPEPTESTPGPDTDLVAFYRQQEADRVERQQAAEQAATEALPASIKATADAEREAYLKATEPTRNAKGYTERQQAYDRVRLAFIPGTAADTAKEAKEKARALPAYADAKAADIETRPI